MSTFNDIAYKKIARYSGILATLIEYLRQIEIDRSESNLLSLGAELSEFIDKHPTFLNDMRVFKEIYNHETIRN